MNCPNCNRPLDDDSFFCKNCGQWIIQNKEEKAGAEPPRPRRKPSRRRVRRRNIMLVILALVLIVGVVAVYSLALRPLLNGEQNPNDPTTNADDTNQPDDNPVDTPTTPDDTAAPPVKPDDTPDDTQDDPITPNDDPTPGDDPAPDPNTPADAVYLLPSDEREITEADLAALSRQEVALARNEIYARYGRTFRNADYDAYFRAQSWYTPDPNYSDDTVAITELEKKNAEFILAYEQRMGWR